MNWIRQDWITVITKMNQTLNCWTQSESPRVMTERNHWLKHWFAERMNRESRLDRKELLSKHWFSKPWSWLKRFIDFNTKLLNESKVNLCHDQNESLTQTLNCWMRYEKTSLISKILHWLEESHGSKSLHHDRKESLTQTLIRCTIQEQILVMTEKIHRFKNWSSEHNRSESQSLMKGFMDSNSMEQVQHTHNCKYKTQHMNM